MQNSLPDQLVLASKSQARRTILTNAGLGFVSVASPVDEKSVQTRLEAAGTLAKDQASLLAASKARTVSAGLPRSIVIGADQILEYDGEILHKVANRDRARERLARLAGKTHILHTAVCLFQSNNCVWQHVEQARLHMRELTYSDIDAALEAEGDGVLTSVGCYRLEGPSICLFERLEGDYFSMLGIPVLPLLGALRQHAPNLVAGAHR